jgi:hypothetical protein
MHISFCTKPTASRCTPPLLPRHTSIVYEQMRKVPSLGHERSDCWDTDHCNPRSISSVQCLQQCQSIHRGERASLEDVGYADTSPVFPTLVMTKTCEDSVCVFHTEELQRTCNGERWYGICVLQHKTRNEGDTEKRDKKEQRLWMDDGCACSPYICGVGVTLNEEHSHTHSWTHAIPLFSMQHVCVLWRSVEIVNGLVWSATSWSSWSSWSSCSPVCN